MAKKKKIARDKSMMVTARTLEILRREALTLSTEGISKGKDGEVSMKKLMSNIAEDIQTRREFTDLPTKDS